MKDLKLYGYWRSSCSWRVRIALHEKGLPFAYQAVHLVQDGGQQRRAEFDALNPMRQVPVLEWEDGGAVRSLGQSLAILELLQEVFPSPPLLPADPYLRGRARMLAECINSGIQPLQNLSVLQSPLVTDGRAFAAERIATGLEALQRLAEPTAGAFLVGDEPSLADVCLVPQLYNARRFDLDLGGLGLLVGIEERCAARPAFAAAHPDRQPDAP